MNHRTKTIGIIDNIEEFRLKKAMTWAELGGIVGVKDKSNMQRAAKRGDFIIFSNSKYTLMPQKFRGSF